jgi:hypothetical protein
MMADVLVDISEPLGGSEEAEAPEAPEQEAPEQEAPETTAPETTVETPQDTDGEADNSTVRSLRSANRSQDRIIKQQGNELAETKAMLKEALEGLKQATVQRTAPTQAPPEEAQEETNPFSPVDNEEEYAQWNSKAIADARRAADKAVSDAREYVDSKLSEKDQEKAQAELINAAQASIDASSDLADSFASRFGDDVWDAISEEANALANQLAFAGKTLTNGALIGLAMDVDEHIAAQVQATLQTKQVSDAQRDTVDNLLKAERSAGANVGSAQTVNVSQMTVPQVQALIPTLPKAAINKLINDLAANDPDKLGKLKFD